VSDMLVRFSVSVLPGPAASADSDETREESDGNEDQDTAGTLSFKVHSKAFIQ